jgi:bacteriophage N4 adsorption protein B
VSSTAYAILQIAAYECQLLAGVGFLVIGIDDLGVDAFWLGRYLHLKWWGSPPLETGKSTKADNTLAIFVPVWREYDVIAAMLTRATALWGTANYRIYVGCYPNDLATIQAVQSVCSSRIQIVINVSQGPTTKGDCLNAIWQQLVHDKSTNQFSAAAIILHDAEDMVHAEELALFARLIESAAVVQIPVLPLPDPGSRWISGHYIDEFCEAHTRDMVLRAALGACLPMAGVGCAIRFDALEVVAQSRNGKPFDADSLTEDYELGLVLGELGCKSVFHRQRQSDGKGLIAVRAHFPETFRSAVRQKARWSVGISLFGWRRLGWHGGMIEYWMRFRDRRTILSALFAALGYFGLILGLTELLLYPHFMLSTSKQHFQILNIIWLINFIFLGWRLAVRAACVAHNYGAIESVRSVPRMLVSSVIMIAAAWQAVRTYVRFLIKHEVVWEKTDHKFPGEEK